MYILLQSGRDARVENKAWLSAVVKDDKPECMGRAILPAWALQVITKERCCQHVKTVNRLQSGYSEATTLPGLGPRDFSIPGVTTVPTSRYLYRE